MNSILESILKGQKEKPAKADMTVVKQAPKKGYIPSDDDEYDIKSEIQDIIETKPNVKHVREVFKEYIEYLEEEYSEDF